MESEQADLFEQPVDPPVQPPQSVREVIERYITSRRDDKLEAAKDDAERQKLMAKYQVDDWIQDASQRVSQIRLATHTAKQQHPSSKASSVFAGLHLPHQGQHVYLGSDDVSLEPDVVGNAAALDIFKMLRLSYQDETLLSRLLRGDDALQAALSNDAQQAALLMSQFQQFAQMPSTLIAGRAAKQLYFPIQQGYHLMVVLYPSSLVHQAWRQITDDRFGEQAKALREARKKDEPSAYESRDYKQLLTHRYGGTKPQNISQLNSDRRGSMWLLPSLPPTWSSKAITLPKAGFFGKSLRFDDQVRPTLRALIDWYKQAYQPNNKPFRDERDRRLALLIDAVIDAALTVQSQAPVGWSATSQLSSAEKIWLDPQYMEQLGEQTELTTEQSALLVLSKRGDWQQQIALAFGAWLNTQLSKTLDDLDDAEQRVWAVYYFADNLKAMSTDLSGEMS